MNKQSTKSVPKRAYALVSLVVIVLLAVVSNRMPYQGIASAVSLQQHNQHSPTSPTSPSLLPADLGSKRHRITVPQVGMDVESELARVPKGAVAAWLSFYDSMANDPQTSSRWLSSKAPGALLLKAPWMDELSINKFEQFTYDATKPLASALTEYLGKWAAASGEDLLATIATAFQTETSEALWQLELAGFRYYAFSDTNRVADQLEWFLARYDAEDPMQVGNPSDIVNAVIATVLADNSLFARFGHLPENTEIEGTVRTSLVHSLIIGINFQVVEPSLTRWLHSGDRWLIFGVLEGLRKKTDPGTKNGPEFSGEMLATLVPRSAVLALGEKLQVIYFELLEERAGEPGVLKLMEICDDSSIVARGQALNFLVMGGHVGLDFVRRYLTDDDQDMHVSVADALYELLPESYDDLWLLYNDSPNQQARARAFEALISTGKIGLDEINAAYDGGPELRAASIAGIGWMERTTDGFHPDWRAIMAGSDTDAAWVASRQWLQNNRDHVFDVAIALENHPSEKLQALGFAQRHLALELLKANLSEEDASKVQAALSGSPPPAHIAKLLGCSSLAEANALFSAGTKEYILSHPKVDVEELLDYLKP